MNETARSSPEGSRVVRRWRRALIVCALASLALPAMALGGFNQNSNWNYTSGTDCVLLDASIASPPTGNYTVGSNTSARFFGSGQGCAAAFQRPAGSIQVKGQLLKQMAGGGYGNCNATGWYSNPSTATARLIQITYGSAYCGSGTYTEATFGMILNGSWKPNTSGTPGVSSGPLAW